MHRFARMAIGAIAVVALSACSSSGSGATAGSSGGGGGSAPCSVATSAGTVTAAIKDFEFDPATVTAKVGDTITWTNNGPAQHTVTLDSQSSCDTGTISAGSTGSLTFTAAGSYPFHCKIHSSMKGTITVTG